MACIVKQPLGDSKGVLVITDAELRGWLDLSPTLRRAFLDLKPRWIILVHCNSAIQQRFSADELIDAYIAGPGDILWEVEPPLYQIEMDCSNFCADEFGRPLGDQFWDLLFISRNQKFKSVEDLFRIVRAVFNHGPMRVLAIISESRLENLASSEPIRLYRSMFTEAERKHFTLLSPWIDYPFSFDLPTLAHFYRHSRAFLHTAVDERHPRVVGYAWAAGIPVVAPRSAAALLPAELARKPGFFPFSKWDEAPELIRRATAITTALPAQYMHFHLEQFQIPRFVEEVKKLYQYLKEPFCDGKWFLKNLNVRLARHHNRLAGTNSCHLSLFQFAKALAGPLPLELGNDPETILDTGQLPQPDNSVVSSERKAAMRRREIVELRDAYRAGGFPKVARIGARMLGRIART